MNIQVGKLYRTRDGCKARVYAIDGVEGEEVHGAVWDEYEDGTAGWASIIWAPDGTDPLYPDGPDELVAEWDEQSDDSEPDVAETAFPEPQLFEIPPSSYALWQGNQSGKNYARKYHGRWLSEQGAPEPHPLYSDRPRPFDQE